MFSLEELTAEARVESEERKSAWLRIADSGEVELVEAEMTRRRASARRIKLKKVDQSNHLE